jgi:hypothetical protein
MAGLYEIIDELRREYSTPSASKTLDMVASELGRTQDNLREALAHLEQRPVPAGGTPVLEELAARARAEGVDQLRVPLSRDEVRMNTEPVTRAQIGIAVLLGGTAVLSVLLAGAALATVFIH